MMRDFPGNPLLRYTRRVTLQLGNRCPMSAEHSLCPVHTFGGLQVLPRKIISGVLADLASMGFGHGRQVCFHVYNEPIIDPRLLSIIEETARVLPDCRPHLWTNGWYLTPGLADEFMGAGMRLLTVSAYGDAAYERLSWVKDLPIEVQFSKARLLRSVMTPQAQPENWQPCYAPLCDITTRASGHVGICCLDHAETVVLGDLNKERFGVWLPREWPKLDKLRAELALRMRKLPVCVKCERRRR